MCIVWCNGVASLTILISRGLFSYLLLVFIFNSKETTFIAFLNSKMVILFLSLFLTGMGLVTSVAAICLASLSELKHCRIYIYVRSCPFGSKMS